MTRVELDPETLSPADRYGFLISAIAPRPIAWVSTIDAAGRPNLAPFSFFTGITAKPMTLCFAPVNTRDGRKKDTLLNVEATGQFVVNAATDELAVAMNETSADLPPGASEFERAGLETVPSVRVRPPAVAASPLQMECELHQIVRIGEGPLGGNLVIGRVVHLRVDDRVWKDNRISHRDLRTVGRLEGAWYARTTDDFELPRPRIKRD